MGRLGADPKLHPRKFEKIVIFVPWRSTEKVIEASKNLKNRDFGAKKNQFLRENTDFPLTFARKHIPHPVGPVLGRLGADPKLHPRKFEKLVIFNEIWRWTPLTGAAQL